MAFETINLGTQPAGTGGDTARSAFEKTNRNFLAAEVLSAAMSQAQFEAIRAQNKERYAASGLVSFGNHESGKQVNECKPGLYTVLSTPNTLRIGKAGGLGDSETDNASVHIDGVVFNLTTQFAITLPPHPTSTLPERMDMYGVESEKVEISAASPNAYQGGLRGVGAAVNLFTATDQQKKDFFSANANTTYIGTDGKIYQWQLYKISFAGTTDGVPSPSEQSYSRNTLGDLWLKAGKNLLYLGDVLRLNNGGYHPSFNPLGAAKFVGDTFWHNTAAGITSKADCFDPTKILAGSGSIATAKSGRPDGRYYDAIYADGQGGVCRDMRYSAYGIDTVDFAEADQKVKNGTYRGFEKGVFTKINAGALTVSGNSKNIYITGSKMGLNCNAGDTFSLYRSNGIVSTSTIEATGTDGWISKDILSNLELVTHVIYASTKLIPSSIGGSFLQTDIIGNPANILATPALANGWQGSWIPVIPDGTSKTYSYTRKALSFAYNYTYTTDNGASWTMPGNMTALNPSNVSNSHFIAHGIITVLVLNYQAFARQTENAVNAVVYGGNSGVGCVLATSDSFLPEQNRGVLLKESLTSGKRGIGGYTNGAVQGLNLTQFTLVADKLLSGRSAYDSAHPPILIDGNTSVDAVKALNYNVNINKQAFIQYAYTELKHNGTNWGDDGKVTIVDNQSTKTDLNGNTVLVGTAKLKEPIGWIKNKV